MKVSLAAVALSAWPVAAQLETGGTGAAFVKYHDYAGNLAVSGTVYIGEVADLHQVVFVDLSGVDPLCTGQQSGVNNTCGIHIHEEGDCAQGTGPHYWNQSVIEDDPWQSVTYTDAADGSTKVVDRVVGTGTNLADLKGRAFIVHDSEGRRVACAIMQNVGAAVKSMEVLNFGKYPVGEAGRDVTATFTVHQHTGNKQVVEFDISGADAECTPDLVDIPTNGCGIHIHAGTNCHDAQGHHWSTEGGRLDPWFNITYRTANAKGVTIPVDTGLTGSQVYARTVVVHNKNGGRMACGRILLQENPPLKTNEFQKYFNYEDNLRPNGVVSVGQSGTGAVGTQVLFANLNDADGNCSIPDQENKTQNVCGMHIHEATNCDGSGLGHFWNKEVLGSGVENDPWVNRYTTGADNGDISQVNLHIKTAFDLKDMDGRTFLVHDSVEPGRRVACAVLGRVEVDATIAHTDDFKKYTGTGAADPNPFTVSGQVGVHQSGNSAQFLTYSLSGLDPACTADFEGGQNECGLHIHAGTSCEDAKGHHYDTGNIDDPWFYIRYVAGPSGTFTGTTVAIETGILRSGLYGRALVVHDSKGGRIACTLIESEESAGPDPIPSPSPGGPGPSPSPGGGSPSPTTEAPNDGVPGWAFGVIGVILAGCCGAGAWFYMNQEGGYDAQEDAPEIEVQEQEQA